MIEDIESTVGVPIISTAAVILYAKAAHMPPHFALLAGLLYFGVQLALGAFILMYLSS